MKSLKNYILNIFEAKAAPEIKDWEQLRDYFEILYKWADECGDRLESANAKVPESEYIKVSNNILEWCEKFAKKLPKFNNAYTKQYPGVIVIADEDRIKQGSYFPLMTFTNVTTSGSWPQGLRAMNYLPKKWDNVGVHYGFRKLGRYDIAEINGTDGYYVFGIEDPNIYAILDKNKFDRGVEFGEGGASGGKKSSGKYKDDFIENMLVNINMKKSEIDESKFDWTSLEPAEVIDVTSMDEKKVIAQMTQIMLKEAEGENVLVLGVDDDEVMFTLFESDRRGRFYMDGFAVAKAFKTLKIFKETFTQRELKRMGVSQLRIYKPNK